MNARLEAKLKTLPHKPGVYFHKAASGEVIYVGKAAVLRNRVRQYFQDSRLRDAKTTALVSEIDFTDWLETESEIDALFLESEMIKRYMPRYNILLRDDKSQIFVRINMHDEWPTVGFTRGPLDDGAEYFGPFYSGAAIKRALRYLRRVYPYLVKAPAKHLSRLETQIGLNPDPVEGSAAYKVNLRRLISYIKGDRVKLQREIEHEMKAAARQQDFERAALLRNRLRAMAELQRRVMFGDSEFMDISKDRALTQLQDILGLRTIPKRIESYDISHHGGSDVVASMVVFANGASERASYRKFKMTKQQNNDTAQMYETLYRRLSEKNLKAWGKPDLLIIDGGKPQLDAALQAQNARGVRFPTIGIAKREEEIIVRRDDATIRVNEELLARSDGAALSVDGEFYILNLHIGQHNQGSHTKNLRGEFTISPFSDSVKLFQRVRDEAHRFAVSYHSVLARKHQIAGVLEEIPGIGAKTKHLLIQKFGSVRGVAKADRSALVDVIGAKKAALVFAALHAADDHAASPPEAVL